MSAENGNNEKFTLVVGVGFFELELLGFLREKRKLKVFDIRESHIDQLGKKFTDIEFIPGDASSYVTWKKINYSAAAQVIITVRDQDIAYETCRIIREVLELEIMIIIISYDAYDTSVLDKFNVTVVSPIKMGLDIVTSLLDKNVSWPVNIGNRQGEIVEVQVLKNSHLVGVRLKHIRPVSWSVAMIYKKGKPTLPTPNTRILIGDRVVIAGEPKVVKGVVDTLVKGEPTFPLQFGQNIAVLTSAGCPALLEEAVYLHNRTMAKKLHILPEGRLPKGLAERLKKDSIEFVAENPVGHYEDVLEAEDMGILLMPKRKGGIFSKYYRYFYRNSPVPVLFSGGHTDYTKVVMSLNTETPSFVLETGVELAKHLGLAYSIIYVAPPEAVRGQKDVEYINFRKNIVADFELSEGVTIDYQVLEGNPVVETKGVVDTADEKILLVTAYDPEDSIGFFNPNVQYHIITGVKCSVLAIPVEDTHA